MSERTERRPPDPPQVPSPMYALAVFLELAIVVAFVAERSPLGLFLCVAYGRFSATWCLIAEYMRGSSS